MGGTWREIKSKACLVIGFLKNYLFHNETRSQMLWKPCQEANKYTATFIYTHKSTFVKLYQCHGAIETFQFVTTKSPSGLPSIFEHWNQSVQLTRESIWNLLTIPRVFTTQSGQSIRVPGPKTFISIPQTIRESSSYKIFKLIYKNYLRSE